MVHNLINEQHHIEALSESMLLIHLLVSDLPVGTSGLIHAVGLEQ